MGKKNVVLDYNFKEYLLEYVVKVCVWFFGIVLISYLDWDFKEWDWKKVGFLKVCNFYEYMIKMGILYRLLLNERFLGFYLVRIFILVKEISYLKNLVFLVF